MGDSGILVVNCGSSSISGALYTGSAPPRWKFKVDNIGKDNAKLETSKGDQSSDAEDHAAGLKAAVGAMAEEVRGITIAGVAHRIVHGGDEFAEPVVIDEEVESRISEWGKLAPLHNPPALKAVQAAKQAFLDATQIAVFDTAFHHDLPPVARNYPLPRDLVIRHRLFRFGFHGISHHRAAKQAARFLDRPLEKLRLVTCHLGGGCSAAAVQAGRSVDTTMGMTPLEGLMMGTRSGDVDPGILLHLQRVKGLSTDDLEHLLNKECGFLGVSRVSNDMRDFMDKAAENPDCRLAIDLFAYRVRKAVAALAASMNGIDAWVVTGEVGENQPLIRQLVAEGLGFMGVSLNSTTNRDARTTDSCPVVDVSADGSRCRTLVVATDEETEIFDQAAPFVS